jgi:hypothetical protein
MWKYYRKALEFAKRECSLAENGIGEYENLSQEDTERLLIKNCEHYMEVIALPEWQKINIDEA